MGKNFPGGSVVKNLPSVEEMQETQFQSLDLPGSGRSPGVGIGNPLQYPCLEICMYRGTWWATVHGVTKSHAHTHAVCTDTL